MRRFVLATVVFLGLGVDAETVRGRVVSCGGHALPGVTVQTGDGDTVVTDLNGRFQFRVAPGSVTIGAELSGFQRAREEFRVYPGQDLEVEIALPMHVIDFCIPTAGSPPVTAWRIDGTIATLRDEPLRGVEVRLINDQSKEVFRAKTSRRGRFRTKHLPLGHYLIRVAAPGYLPKSFEVWTSSCVLACSDPMVLRLTKASLR